MGLGYCAGVIAKISCSQIAKDNLQKTLCATILPNYDDFVKYFGDILQLAEVLCIEMDKLKDALNILSSFKNDNAKDSFVECMAHKLPL